LIKWSVKRANRSSGRPFMPILTLHINHLFIQFCLLGFFHGLNAFVTNTQSYSNRSAYVIV